MSRGPARTARAGSRSVRQGTSRGVAAPAEGPEGNGVRVTPTRTSVKTAIAVLTLEAAAPRTQRGVGVGAGLTGR